MMSDIPKLRFPEFKGEWEEKKLSDFMTRLTRKNSNNESSRALTISSADGLIDQGEFFKKQIASKDTSGYYLLKKGDFAYNKSYSVGYDYGSIKRLDRYEDGVVSTLYICMSLTSDTNSDYLTHYFDSMKWNKSVSEISAEGARNHGLLNIPTEAFFQTKHYLAPSLPEQQKIADFLSNVDSIITAETKILKTLQKKKKALMQKLFTQQLRFKSNDGTDFPAWEEKKLGEVCSYIGGGTPSKKVKEYWNGNINWASVKDITGKYLYETQDKISQLGADSSATNICGRDSLLLITRMSPGKTVITKCITAINQDLKIVNSDINVEFLHLLFQSIQTKIDEKTSSTTVKGISIEGLNQIDIRLPCKAEQEKIADCLSSLDSLIQTQQEVVTTWQQRKKALLQQMFI
ncbi:MAG: type I restriction endonuclease [Treponema bryantii]|nr:type I restriction endonuclease [Treponema bryantii]